MILKSNNVIKSDFYYKVEIILNIVSKSMFYSVSLMFIMFMNNVMNVMFYPNSEKKLDNFLRIFPNQKSFIMFIFLFFFLYFFIINQKKIILNILKKNHSK